MYGCTLSRMSLDTKKLEAARKEAGLTQEEAAKKAGLSSRQAWNNIEGGRVNLTLDTLDRIAKALGVKAKDLLK